MGIWAFDQKADQAVVAGPLAVNTQTLAWGGNVIAGDVLVCVVSWTTTTGVTLSSIADNASPTANTFTLGPMITYGATSTQRIQVGYVVVAKAGTTPTVTATFSTTGATEVQLSLGEWTTPSPSSVANALDVSSTNFGSGSTASSGTTAANASANELCVCYAGAVASIRLSWEGSTFTVKKSAAC